MLGYNRMTGYNKARYNAEGTELFASDSFSLVDNTVTRSILRTLSDLIVSAENTAKIQNKTMEDTMKLDAWLSIDREDASKWRD